jgi:hypothetical protein
MKLRSLLLRCSLLIGLAGAALAGDDTRFSKSLASTEAAAAGFQKLTSDQVAILDALVRRDESAALQSNPNRPRAALFSQRLSADERANAGLNLLTAAEVAQIDTRVAQLETPAVPATVALTGPAGGSPTVTPARRPLPQIHGSISLLYGTGARGYSAQGAALDLIYHDPDRNYTITAGYSEMRTKGRPFRRDCPGAYSAAEPTGAVPPFKQ